MFKTTILGPETPQNRCWHCLQIRYITIVHIKAVVSYRKRSTTVSDGYMAIRAHATSKETYHIIVCIPLLHLS